MDIKKLRQLNIEETKQKLRDSVHADDMIMQSINSVNESKKISNTLVKRLREWYEMYNPEFSKKVVDQEKFCELVSKGEDKKQKGSMGADISNEDINSIRSLAKQAVGQYLFISKQESYLDKMMQKHCPNITAVAGALVGAQLIELAGGLKRLVLFPSSTVQILGAEKALFRHMKKNAKMPKHGVIVQHPLIAEAPKKEHGKRARALADKILLAAKLDYFKGEFLGEKLRKELEKRFR